MRALLANLDAIALSLVAELLAAYLRKGSHNDSDPSP
jgi:hypothetical protein